MKNKIILLLITVVINAGALFAQQMPVKGTVVDGKTNEPLIGVKVQEKGTNNGTMTNFNGEFTLTVSQGATLDISYVGYASQSVKATASPMSISLAEDTKLLDEVVVVGYGTMKSKDLTSAITTVRADEITKTPAGQAMQSLQGKVAGMQIVSSGNPGDQPKVRVRGVGSMPGIGNENPLYIVDGMFFDNIDFLNPSDIATISVLKDASAAAIYGVRAANGVVLIETKSGAKKDRFEVNYNGYYGVQHAQNILKMANAEQYTQMAIESGSAADLGYIQNAMQRFGRSRINPNVPDVNTDWYKEIIRDAPIQNHSLDILGGGEKATYAVGLNYFTQQGLLKMKNDYERFNLRTKLDYKPTKYLSIGTNIIFSNGTKYNQEGNAWRNAYFAVPILPVYDELNTDATPTRYANAKYLGYRGGQNPFPAMDNTNNRMLIRKLVANFYGQLDIIPEKLSLKTTYNHAYTSLYERNVFLPYNIGLDVQNKVSQLTKIHQIYSDQIWDNVLTYTEKFGQHNFTGMLGTSYRSRAFDLLQGQAQGFETDYEQSWYISTVPAINRPQAGVLDNGQRQYGLSYFGRINYNYANRYLLYATMRADGSSKYQEKWGYFPSFGAGWVVSEESFWKSVKAIDYLKFRFGWGQLGNENVPAAAGAATTSPIDVVFNGIKYGGTVTTSNFSYLRWERTEETNIGVTAKMFHNRLDMDADYFIRDTKDAVIPVFTPAVGGFILKNAGVIRNSGLELALNWNDKIGQDFSYNIGGNISTLKNVMKDIYGQFYIDGGTAEFRQRTAVGYPVFSFFGRQVAGVYQNQAEINADPVAVANGLAPGDFKYKDLNNDGKINDDDRTYLGSYFPTLMYGANLGFTYKNLDFSVNCMGQAGNKILNRKRGELIWTNDGNLDADLAVNRWHGEGTSNKYPSSAGLRKGWNQKMSDYFVEDGSFFRIQNVQLGYSFKNIHLSGLNIPLVRIILTAERPLTVFKYNGFNPEVENGIDTQTYPIPAVYTVGLNIKF